MNKQLDLAKQVVTTRVDLSSDMLKSIGVPPEMYQRLALDMLVRWPHLAACDLHSLDVALLTCAELGLVPDGEEAAIYPFKGKAKLVPMIAGRIRIARQATPGLSLRSRPVYEGEKWVHREGADPCLVHEPSADVSRTVDHLVAVYAIAFAPDAAVPEWEVLYRVDIDRYRARSQSPDKGPWKTDYVEMAEKTALGQVLKRLPRRPGMSILDTDLDEPPDWSPEPPVVDVPSRPAEPEEPQPEPTPEEPRQPKRQPRPKQPPPEPPPPRRRQRTSTNLRSRRRV